MGVQEGYGGKGKEVGPRVEGVGVGVGVGMLQEEGAGTGAVEAEDITTRTTANNTMKLAAMLTIRSYFGRRLLSKGGFRSISARK